MSKIEDRTSDEQTKIMEIEGVINIADKPTRQNDAELDGGEQGVQQPKKTSPRKPKKTAEPISLVTEGAETSEPRQAPSKRRQKNVELVSATDETVAEPKRPATRSRKKLVEPASPVAEVQATSTSFVETTNVAPERTPMVEVSVPADVEEAAPLVEASLPADVEEAEPLVKASLPANVEVPVAAVLEEEPMLAVAETVPMVEEEATIPIAFIEEVPVNLAQTPTYHPTTERRHLVKSAGLVALGNLGSSVLGMVRQVVLARLGSLYAGPFLAALTPANNFYQLLVNGAVSGALIPAFNDYSAIEKRDELRRLVFTLVNLILLIVFTAAIGYTLISPWFINALLAQLPSAQRGLALQYSQIIFFSLLALGPFSILLAALYALKEFGWPAFATAAYHIGIILGAIGVFLFGRYYLGSIALPLGVLVGAAGEIALLLPGIRNQRLYYMFVLDLKHPALRHIAKLYLPVFLGFLFTTGAVFLDLSLQSRTSEHAAAIAAMGFATTLIQFPVGLVAAALSFAVLPTLSEHVREGNNERFKQTLLLGFRLGLLLMIPAMVGLFALRTPITYLLFAHGNFGTSGADLTALALQNYAYQLPFVALDQLLIAAFYARKDTKTPVIIGVVSIVFYLIVALPFYQSIGVPALAFANTVQNSMHALILLLLLRRVMGVLHLRTAFPAFLKICLAAALMGATTWGALILLSHITFFSLQDLRGQFLTLIVVGGLAIAVYVGAVLLLKVEEIHLLKGAVLAKLGKR
jgi:putative peptidoglycan lipid II flippase